MIIKKYGFLLLNILVTVNLFSQDIIPKNIRFLDGSEPNYIHFFNRLEPLVLDSNIDTILLRTIYVRKEFTEETELFSEISDNAGRDTLYVELIFKLGVKIKVLAKYRNGLIHRITEFNELGKHGTDIIWYKNGKKKRFAYYRNGELLFPTVSWYSSGKLKYVEDDEIGTYWYPNKIIAKEIYLYKEDDSFKEILYSETGIVVKTAHYNAGIKPILYYYNSGKKKCSGFIKDVGIYQISKWIEWFENGKIKTESFFSDSVPNVRVGVWKYYNEQGELIKEEHYKAGELQETKEYLPLNVKKE